MSLPKKLSAPAPEPRTVALDCHLANLRRLPPLRAPDHAVHRTTRPRPPRLTLRFVHGTRSGTDRSSHEDELMMSPDSVAWRSYEDPADHRPASAGTGKPPRLV